MFDKNGPISGLVRWVLGQLQTFKGKLDMVRQKKMGFFEDHT